MKLTVGDKIRIVDVSGFREDCRWLEGETVEVIKVCDCGHYPILAKHPNDSMDLHLAYDDVELVEE